MRGDIVAAIFFLKSADRPRTHHHASQMEFAMNGDQIEGKCEQEKGKVKEKWGKLTGDDLTRIQGKRDQLAGRTQERYGLTKEQVEEEMKAWERDSKL